MHFPLIILYPYVLLYRLIENKYINFRNILIIVMLSASCRQSHPHRNTNYTPHSLQHYLTPTSRNAVNNKTKVFKEILNKIIAKKNDRKWVF